MPLKQIICLANSRKLGGRCFAGKEIPGSTWIRPVSGRDYEELTLGEMRCGQGRDPKLLDVINVPVVEPRSKQYQPENWLVDQRGAWEWVRRIGRDELESLVDDPATLWLNMGRIGQAENDRVPFTGGLDVTQSLYLLKVIYLKVIVFQQGGLKLRGEFNHRGTKYALRVTDPVIEMQYRPKPLGEYALGPSFITVSLGEPFEGNCYKLIAGIITRDSVRD